MERAKRAPPPGARVREDKIDERLRWLSKQIDQKSSSDAADRAAGRPAPRAPAEDARVHGVRRRGGERAKAGGFGVLAPDAEPDGTTAAGETAEMEGWSRARR